MRTKISVIYADPDMWLTQNYNTPNRIFVKTVYLAVDDKPENWKEVTENEKLEYEQPHVDPEPEPNEN